MAPCCSWSDLPDGIAAIVLRACVADHSTRVARLVCRQWRTLADASVQRVTLRAWPGLGDMRPLSVALPNVSSVALMGPGMVDVQGGRLEALLHDLAQLTG